MMRPQHHHAIPDRTLRRRRLRARNPALATKIAQMKLQLSPLVRIDNGAIHPWFPLSVLHYWLLTDEQCEALAHFYHQRSPGPWSAHYPCPVEWSSKASLEQKRRRIGRFIGLQGCDSPIKLLTEEEIAERARKASWEEEEAIWRAKHMAWRR